MDMGDDAVYAATEVKAQPPSRLRAELYRQAEPWLEQLVQNPESAEIKSELAKLNQQIIAQNKIDKVDENQGTIDVPFFAVNIVSARPFRSKLLQDRNDKDAISKMENIADLIKQKAEQVGYPWEWGRLLLSPDERYRGYGSISLHNNPPQAIDTTSPPNHSESKVVDLAQNRSSSGVQAPKDKTVSFGENVKQEPNDNDVDFDLLDEDHYSDDDSGSAVKASKEDDNDGEGPMTLRKGVPRGPDGKEGVLEGWSKHREMEIIRYGTRNAPYYRWRYGTIEETEKTKDNNLGDRRGENKNGTKWSWTGRQVKALQGVCWNWDEDNYADIEEDPYGLDLIDYTKWVTHQKFPHTLCKVVWTDNTKTWETRTTVRRLFGPGNKAGDKKILENAKLTIGRYAEVGRGERPALSRSPTPGVGMISHSRLSTPSRRPAAPAKVKGSRGASRAPLEESVNQGNSTRSRNGRSLKPQGVKMSLPEFMELMQDALPNTNTTKGIAKLAMAYEIYLGDEDSDEE